MRVGNSLWTIELNDQRGLRPVGRREDGGTSGDFSVVTEEWALYLGLYVNTSYNAPLFPQNCSWPHPRVISSI